MTAAQPSNGRAAEHLPSDLAPYRTLSGKHLKEMDLGWQDQPLQGKARLVLLELKGRDVWSTLPHDATKRHEHLVTTCVTKATDALLMLAAAWLPTTWGQKLKACLPSPLDVGDPDRRIMLIFIVDIPEASRELLLPLREEINRRLAGRIETFGMKRVAVIDFEGATKLGLPIERV